VEISRLNNFKSFISDILPKASKYLTDKFAQDFNYSDRKGYLAKADSLINDFITDAIYSGFPDSLVYSEESSELQRHGHKNGAFTWILDPICGTSNFIKQIPLYVHSLSVLDNTKILCAGIYDVNRDELFLSDGLETTLNGQKVSTSKTKKLDEAFVSVNCNQSAWMDDELKINDLVNKFAPPVTRRVRILESANLELAYVACGRFDAYVNPEDKIWDIAAGSLMIASAGGKAEILHGEIPTLNQCEGIIASNQFLLEPILEIFYS
jgi:myo-inositol-1(or 4)-monophosphatase